MSNRCSDTDLRRWNRELNSTGQPGQRFWSLEQGSVFGFPGWDNIDALMAEVNGAIDDLADADFVARNGNLYEPLRQFFLSRGCTEQRRNNGLPPRLVRGKEGTAAKVYQAYVDKWEK